MSKVLECVECKQSFEFSDNDEKFYAEKGFVEPKRCKDCRQKNKERREGGGGGDNYSGRTQRKEYGESDY